MTVGAALLQEMLVALADDAELCQRLRGLVGACAGAPASTAPDYVDRHAAGLGPSEWRTVTRSIPCFHIGRRLLVRRTDLNGWIEQHRVARSEEKNGASSANGEPDAFQRLIEAGRLRVVRPGEHK